MPMENILCCELWKHIICVYIWEFRAFDKENVSLVSEVILIKDFIIIIVTNTLLPGIELMSLPILNLWYLS